MRRRLLRRRPVEPEGRSPWQRKTKSRSPKRDCPSSPVYRRVALMTGAIRGSDRRSRPLLLVRNGIAGTMATGTLALPARSAAPTTPVARTRRCRFVATGSGRGAAALAVRQAEREVRLPAPWTSTRLVVRESRSPRSSFGCSCVSSGHEPCRRPVEHSRSSLGSDWSVEIRSASRCDYIGDQALCSCDGSACRGT